MICPYCSTDMEPIELNGKTFCSNCGLTIGNTNQPAAPIDQPKIVFTSDKNTPQGEESLNIQPTVAREIPSLTDQENSVKADAERELGISQIEEAKPENTGEVFEPTSSEDSLNKPIKLKVNVAEELPISQFASINPETDLTKTLTEEVVSKPVTTIQESTPEIPSEEIQMNQPQVEIEESAAKELPVIAEAKKLTSVNIEDESEIRTLSPEELNVKPDDDLSEKIKNIDALGTSGILLDILNDEAVAKGKLQNKETLEIASDIVDQIQVKIPETPKDDLVETGRVEKPGTTEPSKPELIISDILDDNFLNPVENLELTAGPVELDLPTPAETAAEDLSLGDKLEKTQNEVIREEIPELNAEGTIEPEELPKSTSEETPTADKSIPQDFFMSTPIDDSEGVLTDLPSFKNKKQKLPKRLKKEIAETVSDLEAEPIEEQASQIVIAPKSEKSKHLKNYFTELFSHEKSLINKKRAKKVKNIITAFLVFIILIIGSYIATKSFRIYTDLNTPNTITITPLKKTDFPVNLPKDIPTGYEQSGAPKYDQNTKSYSNLYVFTSDEKRTITFTQTKAEDPSKLLTDFSTEQNHNFSTKSENSVEYTLFDDGSIAWLKEGYFYSLKIEGETYKDLVYNMALSLE